MVCAQNRLVALREERGQPQVLWEYVLGSHVPGMVVIAPDQTIRAHTSDGFLHCLTSEGKQAWSPACVGEPLGWAAPVVDASGNTYISGYDGGLLRVDAAGRSVPRPYYRSRQKFDSAGIIRQGVLYLGSEDGYVCAISLAGARGVDIWNHAAEQGYAGGFVNSSPAVVADGTLVVAARDENLYGFSPHGETIWNAKTPGQLLGSPVIDPHGHVYLGVSQGERGREARGILLCVDGNSHRIRWQYEAAGAIESTPVIGDDGILYFGDNSGTIHAVNGGGAAQWTVALGSAVRSAGTIPAPERLAFCTDDGLLVVLRCSAQRLAPSPWPKIRRTLAQSGHLGES